MTLAIPAPIVPAASVTPARLLDAPLPDIVAELDVDLVDSSVTDEGFVGAVVVRRDGQLVLSMPVGRPAGERDAVARALLGEALGVTLSPLPEPYRLSVV